MLIVVVLELTAVFVAKAKEIESSSAVEDHVASGSEVHEHVTYIDGSDPQLVTSGLGSADVYGEKNIDENQSGEDDLSRSSIIRFGGEELAGQVIDTDTSEISRTSAVLTGDYRRHILLSANSKSKETEKSPPKQVQDYTSSTEENKSLNIKNFFSYETNSSTSTFDSAISKQNISNFASDFSVHPEFSSLLPVSEGVYSTDYKPGATTEPGASAAGVGPSPCVEHVSRPVRSNVTSLLDTLMLAYDKRLRPGFGGAPVVVKADIEIRSMGPISEKDMVYSLDCYFRQVWTDARLSFNATVERVTNVSLNVKMLERIWHPDTIFINGGPSYVHTITTPNKFFRLSHDGTILYSQRLTIKASCPMHLEKFPMDTQQCPLHIASFGYPVEDVIYEWHYGNELAAVASNDMRLSQFDLRGMPACNVTREFKGTRHSILTVYFDFRRHTGYFLIQVYLPCCLLVVLSWVSFWINREATSDRISLGATTMLTMTFLVLDSRNDLPRVAYSTALDVYVFMCFCFIFASILQFAAVHFFTKYGTAEWDIRPVPETDEKDEDEDEGFDSGETNHENPEHEEVESAFSCLMKMWRCIMSTRSHRFNKNVRNSLGLNSVSKIDKVARVMFPVVFCGLNIVYWMSYW
ncbi:gamma-aminobutyric acid receptor subunit alpha-6-like [Physella acuta]|uniref:gamma-aminobutyric acid receptor subunit alpha-6-like n=1 Tax=Physella acuta TaxID=109671 RepID=UPI0027DE65D8|nr:gamma-aminobutyric acid receptor subunit alpha-6-like [Physella acuta]